MGNRKVLYLLVLLWVSWILAACVAESPTGIDPNISGVKARATLEFVQALQTSTAQAQNSARWQATVQAARTQDAFQATQFAAQATDASSRAAACSCPNPTGVERHRHREQRSDHGHGRCQRYRGELVRHRHPGSLVQPGHGRDCRPAGTADRPGRAGGYGPMAAERQRTINQVQAAAPWVILAIVVPFVIYLAWQFGSVETLRRRAIPRDSRGDAPILILDNHGRRNVIDPDLFFGAAVSIGRNGRPEAPTLAAPELQSAVKARDQAVDLVSRGLPGQTTRRQALPGLPQGQK